MNGQDYYIPAVAMAVSLVFKLPALRTHWRDPLLRSVCVLLVLATLVFTFAAPPTIEAVNRWTGIPNVSAPLVYCLMTAFSASCLILMFNWRGGPAREIRRTTQRWIAGYSVVIVAIVVFAALGDMPVERLRDFDTFYANAPYVRLMIMSYLLAHSVAAVTMVAMCWHWSVQVRGWLRAGLVIIVSGYSISLTYDATKLSAVAARWLGHDLDFLSTYVAPPLASAAALVSAVGFVLPLVCQRVSDSWHTWTTYRRLGALWHEVRSTAPGTPCVRMSWWSPAEIRVIQRESDIHDGFLRLGPCFDRRHRDSAYERARAAGADEETARAVADAAMVAAAVRTSAAAPEGAAEADGDGDGEQVLVAADGPRDLVRISDALRHSPVVAAARRQAALTAS
ncbi:MAB_1171c family putative transporter [Streptomyces sp. NPDC059982]|uniref:MAB_1171c family putative transporter n=1 Tax=unclassified Streptomyces TaxID=2593676 RepID=UPI0036B9BF7E